MIAGKRARIGVILSAGGSAFAEAATIARALPIEFSVVTDRVCGAEARCRDLSIPVTRIVDADRTRFSVAARDHFRRAGTEVVLLHFSRLVGPELFRSMPSCNIHPALLPAFPGLGAVKQAWIAGARFLGATLHFVDETMDGGQIIAQKVDPIPIGADLAWCEHLSFVQKTYLTLLLFELMIQDRLRAENGSISFALRDCPSGIHANPALTDETLINGFEALRTSRA